MPPSPLALNTALGAHSQKKTTNSTSPPLNPIEAQQHEQAAPSEFVTVTKTQATTTIAAPSSASAFPSSTLVYYPGMPGGGFLGANSASDSHAGVAVGVSCGILGVFLIAVAIGFARHIQRGAKNEAARLTARGAHDNFRLQPVSGQQHRQNRQRQRQRLQSEVGQLGHQDLQVELARQWQVHHPIRILRTPGPEGKPRNTTTTTTTTPTTTNNNNNNNNNNNTPAQLRESLEVQLGGTMQMARSWKL